MGYIRKLDTNVDIQTFPGAKFELTGDVPAPQCSEAQIESITGTTRSFPPTDLSDTGKFVGFDLTGKVCHILVSPTGNTGDFGITYNTNSILTLDGDPGASNDVEYYISNGGELILTRNVKSFAQFIHAAGYAYTIKSGKLYTNMPTGLLKDACTILFDPLT